MLFFISLERRRIEHLAITRNPTGVWVTQQARNLTADLADRGTTPPQFLIHDRDSKFSMKEGPRVKLPIFAITSVRSAARASAPTWRLSSVAHFSIAPFKVMSPIGALLW